MEAAHDVELRDPVVPAAAASRTASSIDIVYPPSTPGLRAHAQSAQSTQQRFVGFRYR